MAIANVSIGAISTVTTSTVTPSFGAATTAGNLLVCVAGAVTGGGVLSTSSTGWSSAIVGIFGVSNTAIFYKPNCGSGESAPTVSTSGSSITALYAALSEWSGVATSSPVDQSNESSGTPANDLTAGELAISCRVHSNTKSATYTISSSWTPAGGSVTSLNNTGATKALSAFMGSADIMSANTGHDTNVWTVTPSTGALSTNDTVIASFLLPAAAGSATPNVNIAPYVSY